MARHRPAPSPHLREQIARLHRAVRSPTETATDVAADRGTARMLPSAELREALSAGNRADLLVAASYAEGAGVVTLYRGTLEPLLVPSESFASLGGPPGAAPDLDSLTPTDYGQTLQSGTLEAAADAVLYAFDADERRRAKARLRRDNGLGASVRRLRAQPGLSQRPWPRRQDSRAARSGGLRVEPSRPPAPTP